MLANNICDPHRDVQQTLRDAIGAIFILCMVAVVIGEPKLFNDRETQRADIILVCLRKFNELVDRLNQWLKRGLNPRWKLVTKFTNGVKRWESVLCGKFLNVLK